MGCPAPPPPGSGAKPSNTKQDEQSRPSQLDSRGIRIRWQERTPEGSLRPLLEMHAESGRLEALSQSGFMRRAKGVLYREGKSQARFEAPAVEAKEETSTVVAREGVRIVSVEPPGLTLTADTVTWQADRDKIVLEGNVRFVHQPPGEKKPVARGGPFPHVTVHIHAQELTIP